MSNTNIPSFNDICGTVTQALAETIINRENLIAQLRDEISRLKVDLEYQTRHAEACKYEATLLLKENESFRTKISSHRTTRADFRCCNEQKSDTDPATGVQYGDLH